MPSNTLQMANKHTVWISPDKSSGWNVKQDGEILGHNRLQSRAINTGIKEAKKDEVDLIIQGMDGKIRSKDSYGPDPNPPKDKEN